jgi:hypothetical protein
MTGSLIILLVEQVLFAETSGGMGDALSKTLRSTLLNPEGSYAVAGYGLKAEDYFSLRLAAGGSFVRMRAFRTLGVSDKAHSLIFLRKTNQRRFCHDVLLFNR